MTKSSSQLCTFRVLSAGSPALFVTVAYVTSIRDLRSGTAAEEDVSDLSSAAVEVMFHLPDNGSMGLDLLFDPADAGQARLAVLQSTVPIPLASFRVISPTPAYYWDFDGYVSTFPFTLATQAAKRGTVTVRISGAITETPGTPS